MKIYNDEEMELINNVFDLIALKFNSKEFSDLVREIKELIKENQKYAREIERLNNNIKEVREFAKLRKEMYERQENVVGQEVIISLLNILDKGE